jgi:hypothetical protein
MTATNILERVLDGEKVDMRNVYQRKLAVMAKCKGLKLDKTHPHHGFQYISIQNLEEHLREWMIEEGLDITPTCDPTRPGFMNFPLVNVDDPTDTIDSWWPIAEDDKGWAYTVKYPQMRIFHVGDEEEAKETRDQGTGVRRPIHIPTAPEIGGRPAIPPASGQGALCVFCSEMDYKTARGLSPKLWIANKGPMAGSLQCDGRLPDGGWANHPAPTTAAEDQSAAEAPDFDYEAPR